MTNILSCLQYGQIPAAPLPDAAGRTAMTVPAPSAFDSSPALSAGEGTMPAWLPVTAIVFLAIFLLLKLLDTITLLLLASLQKRTLISLQNIKNSVVRKKQKGLPKDDSKTTSTEKAGSACNALEPDPGIPPESYLNHLPNRSAAPLQKQVTVTADPSTPVEGGLAFSADQVFKNTRLTISSSPVCHLSVNEGIHLNPNLPVTFDPGEEFSSPLELHDGNIVVPDSKCFAGDNTATFFTSHDFFRVFHFINTSGQTVHPGRPLHILSVEKPARVRKEGMRYILIEMGTLRVEEK